MKAVINAKIVLPEEIIRGNVIINGNLFGSRLTVADCAYNFMKATGADIKVAFKCASTNSAKALGLYDKIGSVEAGKKANLVITDENFLVRKVIFNGNEIREVRKHAVSQDGFA